MARLLAEEELFRGEVQKAANTAQARARLSPAAGPAIPDALIWERAKNVVAGLLGNYRIEAL